MNFIAFNYVDGKEARGYSLSIRRFNSICHHTISKGVRIVRITISLQHRYLWCKKYSLRDAIRLRYKKSCSSRNESNWSELVDHCFGIISYLLVSLYVFYPGPPAKYADNNLHISLVTSNYFSTPRE